MESTFEFGRSRSTAALNALLNHPALRENFGGDHYLNAAELIDDSLFYLSEGGGMIFIKNFPGIWEGHYLFLPECRGAKARNLALGMIHACVLEGSAKMVWGQVPVQNRAARLFTRQLGFTSLGIRQRPDQATELFVLGRQWDSSAKSLVA